MGSEARFVRCAHLTMWFDLLVVRNRSLVTRMLQEEPESRINAQLLCQVLILIIIRTWHNRYVPIHVLPPVVCVVVTWWLLCGFVLPLPACGAQILALHIHLIMM